MSRAVDAGALLDGSAWTTYQKLLTALAALAVIFDGFDIQILGFAIPSLIREWHVARADFAPCSPSVWQEWRWAVRWRGTAAIASASATPGVAASPGKGFCMQ